MAGGGEDEEEEAVRLPCHNSRARVNAPLARSALGEGKQKKNKKYLCIFCICMALGYCIQIHMLGLFSCCAAVSFCFLALRRF